MDKRTVYINGEEQVWGRIMLGRNRDIPSYRKMTDGKMKPVSKGDVPQIVKDSFNIIQVPDGPLMTDGPDDFGMDDTIPQPEYSYIEELEKNSIYTCTLNDLCKALYQRFGIYTCYLKREPKDVDVHPITGALMSNFTLGQTRQQYFTAVRNKTNYDAKVMANILKSREQTHFDFQSHREMHQERFTQPDIEMPSEDNPYADKNMTMEEWRQARAKANAPIMMSEKGRFDDGTDADEIYAEPPINGRTIIRDYPTNPIAERRLREKRERREQYGY